MKPSHIGAFEAKTHFSELLEKVRRGQSFVVTKRGEPVAELGPVSAPSSRPTFGSASEQVQLAPDFDKPLPEMREYEE